MESSRAGREPGAEVSVLEVSGAPSFAVCCCLAHTCARRAYRFILHLPVLRLAPNSYWTDHIQPFWDSLAEKDLSTTVERDEVTKR